MSFKLLKKKKKYIIDQKTISELCKILNIKHAAFLKDRLFVISCTKENEMIEVELILKNSDESFYYPVTACLNGEVYKQSDKELALILLDYLDIYFDSFFKEDENVFVPIDWVEHQFEGVHLRMKGQVLNRYQELKANELLSAE